MDRERQQNFGEEETAKLSKEREQAALHLRRDVWELCRESQYKSGAESKGGTGSGDCPDSRLDGAEPDFSLGDSLPCHGKTAYADLEQLLWDTLILFAGYPFKTAKGLEFTYKIKGNEMFVSRKEKSITRATVDMTFQKALEQNCIVAGPKKLGTFGASYLYPVFIRIGVIVPVQIQMAGLQEGE